MDNYSNNCFDGNGLLFLLFFVLLLGGGNLNGMNGNAMNSALTRSELTEAFNFNDVQRDILGIQKGVCDGFYNQNTTLLNGMNNMNNQLMQNRFAQQQCCCEISRQIGDLGGRLENVVTRSAQDIKDMFSSGTIQNLRDRLADRDRDFGRMENAFLIEKQTQNIQNMIAGNCDGGYNGYNNNFYGYYPIPR